MTFILVLAPLIVCPGAQTNRMLDLPGKSVITPSSETRIYPAAEEKAVLPFRMEIVPLRSRRTQRHYVIH